MVVLAVDIGGTAIKLGKITGGRSVSDFREVPTNAHLGADAMMETIGKLCLEMKPYDAIGVSTAMQVNPKSGSILQATETFPGYTGMPVKAMLEAQTGVPVTVENDVNAVAIAEGAYGAAQGLQNFLCLAYGTGIGGALVIDGNLYYGSHYSAGEVGHMLLHAGGRQCTCGQLGCYETYASTRALLQLCRDELGQELTGRQVCARLDAQDPLVTTVVDRWVQEVVWGLASLVAILNPPVIVMGGGIMEDALLFEKIKTKLPGELMPSYRGVQLRKAALGNRAGMIGATLLALQNLK